MQACNFIAKRPHYKSFPVNLTKLLRAPILKNIFERLLLNVRKYAVNNILQLLLEQPSTGIDNASMKIENICQIPEKSIQNEVLVWIIEYLNHLDHQSLPVFNLNIVIIERPFSCFALFCFVIVVVVAVFFFRGGGGKGWVRWNDREKVT